MEKRTKRTDSENMSANKRASKQNAKNTQMEAGSERARTSKAKSAGKTSASKRSRSTSRTKNCN